MVWLVGVVWLVRRGVVWCGVVWLVWRDVTWRGRCDMAGLFVVVMWCGV